MRQLDETDAEIIRLLVEDGRRPYSDIAAAVDLSPPAVRDRIVRLRELGVIRRFTVDLDRSALRAGLPVLIEIDARPEFRDELRASLTEADEVTHVFATADARLIAKADVTDGDAAAFLAAAVDLDRVRDFEVELLTDASWSPDVVGTEFDLECAECGNTVTDEGEAARIDGSPYHFCCRSCRARFEERHEELLEGT